MENIFRWIVELNKSNHIGFAVLTVLTMVVIGCALAFSIELLFAKIGAKSDKIIPGNHRYKRKSVDTELKRT